MVSDEADGEREPVVFRDETGDLVFVDGGPAPQGYAPVAWKHSDDGSRFVVDPSVDTIAVVRTISRCRTGRRGFDRDGGE